MTHVLTVLLQYMISLWLASAHESKKFTTQKYPRDELIRSNKFESTNWHQFCIAKDRIRNAHVCTVLSFIFLATIFSYAKLYQWNTLGKAIIHINNQKKKHLVQITIPRCKMFVERKLFSFRSCYISMPGASIKGVENSSSWKRGTWLAKQIEQTRSRLIASWCQFLSRWWAFRFLKASVKPRHDPTVTDNCK